MTGDRLQRYQADWSDLHGGVPPTGLVGAWLRLIYGLVRPLAAARVPPAALTVAGVLLGLVALWPAPTLPVLAGVLVFASALCDGMDGTLALLTDRVSRLGSVLDGVCDRVVDALFTAVLWRAGAPPWLALTAVATGFGHEYLRAAARLAGMSEIGAVTVGERPVRVVVTGMFLLAAATPVLTPAGWATAAATALVVMGLVGLMQLGRVVVRALRSGPAIG